MLVIVDGIVMELKSDSLSPILNMLFPITVKPVKKEIFVREEHSANAKDPYKRKL
jgi:hypothetical protein